MKKIILLLSLFFPFCAFADEILPIESVPLETVYGSSFTLRPIDVWVDMINSAKESIDIEQFYLESKEGEGMQEVLKAIESAAERGVKIRVIFEKVMMNVSSKYLPLLNQKNIEVRIIEFRKIAGGVQHAKFFIVDRTEAYVGSQNFDWRSLTHIHELGLRLKSKKAALALSKIFESDWTAALENNGHKKRIKLDLSCKKPEKASFLNEEVKWCMAFSPDKGGKYTSEIDEILKIINSSKESIVAQVMTYSSKRKFDILEKAFISAAKRGVKVRLIFSDWALGYGKEAAIKKLSGIENIEIKISSIPEFSGGFIPFSRVEHLKYICSDRRILMISTSNWGYEYFYQTRGAAVVIEGLAAGKLGHDIFERSWNSPYVFPFDPQKKYEARKKS